MPETGRLLGTFVAVLAVIGLAVAPAARADFGFEQLSIGFVDEEGAAVAKAGAHPFGFTLAFELNTVPDPNFGEIPDQALKNLRVELPPGVVGNPTLLPRCSRGDFLSESCPPDTVVGTIVPHTTLTEEEFLVFNLEPPPGTAAAFGFGASVVPITLEVGINPDPPFNLVVSLSNVTQSGWVYGASLTLFGTPDGVPFLTLPRTCGAPLAATFEASSWQVPGRWVSQKTEALDGSEALTLDGCAELRFSARARVTPTPRSAGSPTGLDLTVDADDEGYLDGAVPVQADIRDAVFELPEGLTVNPAGADGLAGCTTAAVARETALSSPGAGCPEAARIGTLRVESPLFDAALTGSVFVAQPDDPATTAPGAENPFDSLFALYLVVKDPDLGVLIDLPVEIEADSSSGRLVARVEGLPQLPASHVEVHLRDGPRAPLQTPEACVAATSKYRFTPWSEAGPLDGASGFAIDRGCGSRVFAPRVRAGTVEPSAGASSPFVFYLQREDGEENPSRLTLALPPGLSARLGGVPVCPDPLVSSGACPEASRVGSVRVATGAGSSPLWIPSSANPPGSVYLAGPYRGAPFSLLIAIRAEAGPFDLGWQVLRAAIRVNPRSGRATIESDPLPQILGGVPISYRAIRLELDRHGFIRNPTSCAASEIRGMITSSRGGTAVSSQRFQATRCGRLDFEPKLSLRLLGPTHRGAHPRLRASLRNRSGEANLRRVALTLPGAELLDSRQIAGVCSSVSFAEGSCPPSSIYGYAKAWSPLLDRPLRGPIYLRASNRMLPDLVASLEGRFHIDLVARVEAARGRVRFVFDPLPDLPLRRFYFTTRGGKRGLLVNAGRLCAEPRHASTRFVAQNAEKYAARPVLRMECAVQ